MHCGEPLSESEEDREEEDWETGRKCQCHRDNEGEWP
jgi:hypothetical protein